MIRFFGFVLIVSGVSCAGILQAAFVKRVHRMYEELRLALIWMRNEILYSLAPVEQASRHVSSLLPPPLSGLFSALADGIGEDPGCSTIGIAAHYFAAVPEIPAELQDVVYDLLRMLGRQDSAAQVNALKLAESRTESLLEQLEKDKTERCRSYRTLGVCAGLALAVILI